MLSRTYSDNKYDKPEADARIEMQTIKALEKMGIHGITAELTNQATKEPKSAVGAAAGTGKQPANSSPEMSALMGILGAGADGAEGGKKNNKNVLGMDFEIPDELSQILAQEMARQ